MPRSSRAILSVLTFMVLSVVGMSGAVSASAQSVQTDRGPTVLEQADAFYEAGDYNGARRLYQQVLRREARSIPALIGMGRSMAELSAGRMRALEYLSRAVRYAPEDPDPHYYKALVHLQLAENDLGRDNARAGMEELEKVVQLDPSHHDAHYRRGMMLRTIYEDNDAARAAFQRQLEANPTHLDARQQLLETQVMGGNWRAAVRAGDALLARDPDRIEAYPYLAASHWYLGEADRALEVFDRYFERLEEEERNLYFDLSLVLTPEEQAEFGALDTDGRSYYLKHYWGVRDPNPRTKVNERLLEHYIRVAYSRIEFSLNGWPWDQRGEVYVRYGEPDVRVGWGRPYPEDFLDEDPVLGARKREFEESIGMPRSDLGGAEEERAWAGRTPERWVYIGRGIDIRFHDPVMSGRFLVANDRGRMLVERMEEKVPTLSVEEDRIPRIEPLETVVTFKGSAGKTAMEYAFALLPEEFGIFRSPDGEFAQIDISAQLFTPGWIPVSGASELDRRVQTIPQVKVRGIPLFVDLTRLEAVPGAYVLTTMLVDPGTGARATVEESVEIPDYSGTELMISDILPAALVREVGRGREGRFIRDELEVLPLPGGTLQSDQSLFIYYEIYNLTKDEYGATDYQIEYAVFESREGEGIGRKLLRGIRDLFRSGDALAGLSSTVTASGIRTDQPAYIEIAMNLAPPGTYEVQVIVTDRLSGQRAANTLAYRTLPPR